MKHAGFWIRFVAYLIDSLLYTPSYFLLLLPSWGIWYFFYYVLITGALIWFESSEMQGTPGKIILGLKVTDTEGNRISFPIAFLRFLGKILSSIVMYIGFIMIAFTKKKVGLHDIVAKTYVVYK